MAVERVVLANKKWDIEGSLKHSEENNQLLEQMMVTAWNDSTIVEAFENGNLQDKIKQKQYMEAYFRERLGEARKKEKRTLQQQQDKQAKKNRLERQRTVS